MAQFKETRSNLTDEDNSSSNGVFKVISMLNHPNVQPSCPLNRQNKRLESLNIIKVQL